MNANVMPALNSPLFCCYYVTYDSIISCYFNMLEKCSSLWKVFFLNGDFFSCTITAYIIIIVRYLILVSETSLFGENK